MNHEKMEKALVWAIARIAQKACRNGEKGARDWPTLDHLTFYESWRCVGDKYAKSVMAVMLAAGLGPEDERKAEEFKVEVLEAEHERVVAERDALRAENLRLRTALDRIGNPRRYARKVLGKGKRK